MGKSMKVYAVVGIGAIEDHWIVKTVVDVFSSAESAENRKQELISAIPEGKYFLDEDIYDYEVIEYEVKS